MKQRVISFVVLLCAVFTGAWAQKTIGNPITSADQLVTGNYVISAWSKGFEGLLIGNDYANITTTAVTAGNTITDATWIWTVTRNNDGTITLTKSSGDQISINGKDGVGKHNIQWTSANYPVANLTINSSVVTINEVSHWMLRQENRMYNSTSTASADQLYAYLHCNGSTRGTTDSNLRLSWWESYNAGTGSNVSCVKFAFYPVIVANPIQESLNTLISTIEADYNSKNTPTYGENLIKQASQFSSPFSQNDLGNTDGGNLSAGVLIDNNTSTYWHSYWGGSTALSNHSHYVQVAMTEPISGTIRVKMSRRTDADNDHCVLLGVWASNSADGEYTQISQVSLPFGQKGETVYGTFTLPTPYQYFRFWNDDSNGTGYDRGYWHMSEFQLNEENEAYNTLHSELATALQTALNKAKLITSGATQADVDELQRAYDLYLGNIVIDTEAINEAIDKVSHSSTVLYGSSDEQGTPAYTAKQALEALLTTGGPVGEIMETFYASANNKVIMLRNYSDDSKYMIATKGASDPGTQLAANAKDGSSAFRLEYVASSNGQYRLYNLAAENYIAKTPAQSQRIQMSSTPANFTIKYREYNGKPVNVVAFVCVDPTDATHNSLHRNGENNIVAWQATATGDDDNKSTYWTIEESDLTDEQINAAKTAIQNNRPQQVTLNYVTNTGYTWTRIVENVTPGTDISSQLETTYNVDFYTNFVVAGNAVVAHDNKVLTINCDEAFPFEASKLCRIQSVGTDGRDLDYFAANNNTWVNSGSGVPSMSANANIWIFEHAEGAPDIFSVKNFATNQYITLTTGLGTLRDIKNGSALDPQSTTSYFRVRRSTSTDSRNIEGVFCLQNNYNANVCVSLHNAAQSIGIWNAGSETAALSNIDNALRVLPIESFTTTLNSIENDGYYGTIYSDLNMTLPEGVQAYRATLNGETLHLDEVEGVLPAGAYVLYQPAPEVSTGAKTTAAITMSNPTASDEENVLTGTLIEGKPLPAGINFALSGKNGKIGFYKYSPTTYPVAKAVYCGGQTAVSAFSFDFGDPLTTAIQELQKENQELGTIFDLQGRRILKAQKGMNIINGRKVLR